MMRQAPSSGKVTSSIFPFGAAAFGIAIFIADTLTHLEIAVAVLYVVVVLMAARFVQRRGVLLVSAGCVGLTVLSFFLSHPMRPEPTGLINTLLSILAIGLTTFLVRRSQTAEMVLREQASLLNLTHDTIFVRGMDDAITYWNHGAEELYGWTTKEAVGHISHDILRTVFPAPLAEIMEELTRTGRWEGELVHTRRDSTQVVVTSRWALQRNKQGQPVAILETNNDVTERRQAQDGLLKAQAELAHVTRVMTMGELVASIAHEVNQPLGAIVTSGHACVRLLSREVPDIDKSLETIGRMIKDGMRASEVIKRIRAILHKTPTEKAPLNINETIQEVIALVSSDVLRSKVEMRAELAPDLPPVAGDRIQLQQVILNLILNGKDAMSGVKTNPRELLITSRKGMAGELVVGVCDSGHGLDPADAERIFDPFFTTKAEGMGLGLSISRNIIEAHGGALWATPNEDRGATIQFTLPPSGT